MVQQGTLLKVTDKTGVMVVQCVKVLYYGRRRTAKLGDVILVSVKRLNNKHFKNMPLRKKRKFMKGTLHRALVVRSKVHFRRANGAHLRFDENSVVIVNKKKVPISNRINGPILREFCMTIPSLGCVTRFMI